MTNTPCGKKESHFLLDNLDHFQINFTTFSDRFRNVLGLFLDRFGSFSDRFAWFLRCFFCFFGVVDVVIIVFVVIAVIVVGGLPPPTPTAEKIASIFLFPQLVGYKSTRTA